MLITDWRRGERVRIARIAGIRPQRMSEYTRGVRRPSYDMSRKLEAAALQVRGEDRQIPWSLWIGAKH